MKYPDKPWSDRAMHAEREWRREKDWRKELWHENERLKEQLETLRQRVDAVLALEGVVFASDPKERPMLAQGVVRRVLRGEASSPATEPKEGA